MLGRRFTYNIQDNVKSRLDKMFMSLEWLDVWPELKQVVFDRSVSNHYTFVVTHISHLFNKIENGKAMRLDA